MKEIKDNNEEYHVIRNERELREKLKMVMEDPDMELDFFKGLNREIPPASTFMKGTPKPAPFWLRFKRPLTTVAVLVVGFGVGLLFNYNVEEVSGDRTHVSEWDIILDEIENLDQPLTISTEGYENGLHEVSTTSEEMAIQILAAYPYIPYPVYMPPNFLFESMAVNNFNTENWRVNYVFVGTEDEMLFLTVSNDSSEYTLDSALYINDPRDLTIDGEVFISYQEDPLEPNNVYSKRWITGQVVFLAGPFEKNELEAIVESLNYEPS